MPKFIKAGAAGAAMLAIGWSQNAPAQDVMQPAPGIVTLDDFSGSMALSNDGGTYLLFDKMINRGPALDDGYSRIGLRSTMYDTGNGHFFGEIHGLITDHSRVGVNVGGGYRWFDGNAIWGVNSWYDDYETRTGNRYQQIGFGAEYLSPGFDARINGYAPIGDRTNYVSLIDPGTQTLYFGNTVGTLGLGAFESSQAGFDVEGGVPVPGLDWARGYAGMYYLTADGLDTTGVRARGEARFTEGVTLNFIAQNDNTRGTNLNINVEVQFSGQMPTRFGVPYAAVTRRFDQVRRTWGVQTLDHTENVNVPLINPDTGEAYRIFWVDNTNAGGGRGSFEDPSMGLPPVAPNSDLVLVRRGVGNTTGNISLLTDQRLLGEGKAHFINTDRLGVIQLPTTGFSDTGALPTLVTGMVGTPIITVADNTEVSGFNFAGFGTAIAGNDVENVLLQCLTGDVRNGIQLRGASGTAIIRDVDFNIGTGGTGISVRNDTRAPLMLDIDRVMTTSGSVGVEIAALRSPVTATLDRVTSTGATDTGLLLIGESTDLNTVVTSSNFLAGSGDGIDMRLRGTDGTTTFDRLIASNNAQDGIHAVADAQSDYNLNIINSTLRGNGDDNIDTDSIRTSRFKVFVDPTTASNAGDNNFEFLVDSGSTLVGTFLDTDLTGAGTDGINGLVRGGGTATLDFQRSLASGAGQDGYDVTVINGSALFTNVANGSFSGAGQDGFRQTVSNNSTATVILNDTDSANSGNTGFAFDVTGGASGPSLFNATINDGSLDNNGVNNIRGTVTQQSQANIVMSNVTASGGASAGGVDFNVQSAARLIGVWNGGSASNTGADGIDVQVTGSGSRANLALSNLTINNNAGDGVNARLTNGRPGSDLTIGFNNVTINQNSIHGVDYEITGEDATGALTFANTTIRANRDGVQFDVRDGADFVLSSPTFGNDFSNNRDNAIQGIVSDAGSTALVDLQAIDASNAGNSALVFDVSNSGVMSVNMLGSNVVSAGRDGLMADVTTGGTLIFMDTQSLFSGNGSAGTHSGVNINVDGTNSQAVAMFLGSVANGNTLDGFTFAVTNDGSLTAQLDGTASPVTAIGNLRNGVRFIGVNANEANLVMSGPNVFDLNGATNVLYGVSGANQAVASFSGSSTNSFGDGVNVRMQDVVNGAINLQTVTGIIENNVGDGIAIDLVNTNLGSATVKGVTYDGLSITGFNIINNGGAGIRIDSDNSDVSQAIIDGNFIDQNQNGIIANLLNGSDWDLSITNNFVLTSAQYGILVNQGDNDTQSTITIDTNTVASSLDTNVAVNLSGSAVAAVHIDNNIIDGDGLPGDPVFNIGLNFLADSFSLFGSSEPPDTMGAVGPNHIVELLNDAFSIYDKTTGTLLQRTLDETFWTNAGASLGSSDVFDHRIIFDPVSQRWFASTITRGTGNEILIAVSDTDDPTGTWQSVQFIGDVDDTLFNDFDTLAVDGDAIVIGTNNFDATDAFQNVSLFSIPKADLLLATPTAANLSRFENLAETTIGFTPQPVVSDDVDSTAYSLSADYVNSPGGQLLLTTLNNVDTATAAVGTTATISGVPSFTFAPLATQPGGLVDSGGDRINSNVVEVNGRFWGSQAVDVAGRSGILWYEIDPTTNSVIQSGTIADPGTDYFFPSIAVNNRGEVVIGFSGSSDTQFISSMAAFGTTTGGITTFQAPQLLASGSSTYFGSRWGDYSATVVDPSTQDAFWTFQEIALSPTTYGTQITRFDITFSNISTGNTANEGIRVTAADNAQMLASTVSGNTVTGNGGNGIQASATDNAIIDSLDINGNTITASGGNGVQASAANNVTVGALNINGNTIDTSGGNGVLTSFMDATSTGLLSIDGNAVTNSGAHGIVTTLTQTASATSIAVDNNISNANIQDGIRVRATGTTTIGSLTTDGNSVSGNGGTGIFIETASPVTLGALSVSNNVNVANNAGDGIDILLTNVLGTPNIDINGNVVQDNQGRGIFANLVDTSVGDLSASFNIVRRNSGGAGLSVLLNNTGGAAEVANQLLLTNNAIQENGGTGLDVLLNDISNISQVAVTDTEIQDNIGAGYTLTVNNGNIGDVVVARTNINNNTGGDGLLMDLTGSSIANQLIIDSSSVSGNLLNGVNLDLDGTTINDLQISNNNQGSQLVPGTLDVDFTNLIWTTFIDNNSSASLDIASITLDISPAGQIWRPDQTPFNDRFEVTGTSDVTVGLQAINGVAVNAGTNPLQDLGGNVLPNGGVPLNTSSVNFDFNDFTSGEQFEYSLAHSLPGGNILSGNTLVGSIMTVTLADGRSASATFTNTTQSVTQAFAATFPGISSNGLGGIRLSAANGSDIGSLNVDNNEINSNGGHGLELLVANSTLPAANGNISNNTISNHANGDGVRLINPDTNGTPFTLNFNGNTISNNTGGGGINVAIDDNAAGMTSDFTGNTVSGNGAGGILLTANQNTTLNTTFNGNTLADNTEVGIGFNLSNSATAAIDIQSTTVTGTTNGGAVTLFNGDGVSLQARDDVHVTQFNVLNSTVSNNARDGIQVNPFVNTQVDDITVQGSTIDGNRHGVNITRRDNVAFNGGTRGSILVGGAGAGNSFSNNTTDAVRLVFGGTNATQPIQVDENTIAGGVNGVHLIGQNSIVTTGSIMDNTISSTTNDGVLVSLNNSAALGDPLTPAVPFNMTGNTFNSIGNNAIDLQSTGSGYINADLGASAANRLTINGATNGININAAGAPGVASSFNIDGADITGVTNNGINATLSAGQNQLNIADTNVQGAGNIGINVVDTSTGPTTLTMNGVLVDGSTNDGIAIRKTAGGVMDATLLDTSSSFNGGRGLLIEATNDNAGRNTFNVGQIGGTQLRFTDNGLQGVHFITRATTMDQTQNGGNTDVQVNTGLTDPAPGQYVDTGSRDRVVATMNLFNAFIVGNGADGVLLDVGSNTLMNSQLAGLQLGGNGSTDITIRPIVSANPPSSIDSAVAGNDVLVFDPVAHLDLVLGSADLDNDGLAENNASTHNSGTQIGVAFAGANFTNADPFKTNRAVQLAGHVQIDGLLNTPNNDFIDIFQQDIQALFAGQPFFTVVPQTLFPDNTP
ncbi:MAG: right-handed parallel beta-helix repeat-containing protein [Planctomycetaceae bacterium]